MFSARCILMVDLTISLSNRYSSAAIVVSLLLWRIASIWRLMINNSCVISLHKAKFLSSNFLISQAVPDVEAIILIEVLILLVLSFRKLFLFLYRCFLSPRSLWYRLLTLIMRLVIFSHLWCACVEAEVWILMRKNKHRVSMRTCVISRMQYTQRVFREREL